MGEPLDEWDVTVGLLRTSSGLDGSVKVEPLTFDPERFELLKQVAIKTARGKRLFRVERVEFRDKLLLLKLEGIDSREAAKALASSRIMIREADRLPLDEPDEFYVDELLGLEIVTESGESLGPIIEVLNYPANDVYETPLALVPAIRQIVKQIDLKARRVIVEDRPGLRKADL